MDYRSVSHAEVEYDQIQSYYYEIAKKLNSDDKEALLMNDLEERLAQGYRDIEDSIYEHIRTILAMIIDPIPKQQFNQTCSAFGVTYAKAFEVFASALLGEMDRSKRFEVSGQANDRGADILAINRQGGMIFGVCQVKLGSYFSSGKGNGIVLQLVGTCVLFGVHNGIIISNESRSSLTKNTNKIIEEVAQKGYHIKTMFLEDIEKLLRDEKVRKAFIINHFNSIIPRKDEARIAYKMKCSCYRTFERRTEWSLRTDLYWQKLAERENLDRRFVKHNRECFIHWDSWEISRNYNHNF